MSVNFSVLRDISWHSPQVNRWMKENRCAIAGTIATLGILSAGYAIYRTKSNASSSTIIANLTQSAPAFHEPLDAQPPIAPQPAQNTPPPLPQQTILPPTQLEPAFHEPLDAQPLIAPQPTQNTPPPLPQQTILLPTQLEPSKHRIACENTPNDWVILYDHINIANKPKFLCNGLEKAQQINDYLEGPGQGTILHCANLDLSLTHLRSLPTIIGLFRNLQELFLSGNALQTLPEEIGDLHMLEGLALHYNKLLELPPTIGKLTKLKKLSLQYNNLRTLPEEMRNFQELTWLGIEGNPFTEYPSVISQLGALIDVDEVELPQQPFPATPEQQKLDEELRTAIRNGMVSDCRECIARGANPKANHTGESLLTAAIDLEDLIKCKLLIDNGVYPSPEERAKLQDLLFQISPAYFSDKMARFLIQRPPPGAPQIWFKNRFRSLEALYKNCPQLLGRLVKKIALLNIVDERFENPNYGVVSNRFDSVTNRSTHELLDETRTLMRAFIQEHDHLFSVIGRVKTCVPHLPIENWHLSGHANEYSIETGSGFRHFLTHTDGDEIVQIARMMSTSGIISLSGCSCGKGDENLAQILSKHTNERIVCAASGHTTTITWKTIHLNHEKSILLPFFTSSNDQFTKTRAYINGQLIGSGTIDDESFSTAVLKKVTIPATSLFHK
jgi:hypothetical protein